jgi:tRNA-splicing ligase RtcB (3'-phosphate/5'-hydroxy nucleic acid ligase)
MKKVIYNKDNQRIPIKLWLNDVEESAMEQIMNLSNLPFAFHHIAIMPDCHTGYGMPIGGVMATKGIIIPNAVGVDIGCGMCAVKTNIKVNDLSIDTIKIIMGRIRKEIPVGFEHHEEKQDENLMPYWNGVGGGFITERENNSALKQLGTLGGGNHFIEIQKDNEGYLWVMIHSGSRNLGKKVADHYNKLAVELNGRWFSFVPKEWELAFFPIETQEAKDYMLEMQYCVDFALANRKLMMSNIIKILCSIDSNFDFEPMINIAHNYAAWENHFDKNIIIHRKGATRARSGEIGIIPGSQGTKSYIVQGKGNPESFMSCSHGAGRAMGRKQAQRELNIETEKKRLEDKGIIHSIRTEQDLDEAAGAYKDIDIVMKNQEDLVEIITELSPIAVIKG